MVHRTNDPNQAATFIKDLGNLSDPRDNRGKRLDLAFTVGSAALGILSGRSKVSSIHRYMENRADWIRKTIEKPKAKIVSRAHLPRMLKIVDLAELNDIVEIHFGVRLEVDDRDEWSAIDGKTLRGTTNAKNKQGERTLLATTHTERNILAQRPMSGPKSSEITAARELLREIGLEKKKVTLDALHLNPTTTSQINLAGGIYIIQAKDNQKELKKQFEHLFASETPLGIVSTTEQGHGRYEARKGIFIDLEKVDFDDRWKDSGFQTLIVMDRQTIRMARQKVSSETSYYVSNQKADAAQHGKQSNLFHAIRRHWGIESDNWIRDVTLGEDQVKTKHDNQAHVMACLRTLAMHLLRKIDSKNFQATIETFSDCPDRFETFLHQTGFV
jgi:predicted transposase YbfD/YdcC